VKLLPFLLLFLGSTVQAHDELEYKTHFLFTWTSNCVQKILPDFQRQGMPYLFAVSMASQGCGCVIDEFRKHHTQNDVLGFSDEERMEKSMYYTQICAGEVKEM
jgi:hypothetical protein